jgi:hypothetical protein
MCFLCRYEYGILKPVSVMLKKERGRKRENNGGDEPTWETTYMYSEMS